MKSLKQKVVMAGVILAAAASTLASAADQNAYFERQRQMTDGNNFYLDYAYPSKPATVEAKSVETVAAPVAATKESAQFEIFEHQLERTDGTAQSYTPSEHAVAGK